jgi:hypothetical protein
MECLSRTLWFTRYSALYREIDSNAFIRRGELLFGPIRALYSTLGFVEGSIIVKYVHCL